MSNSTFSKNLFDVLGEEDDVRQPAPTKTEKKTNDKARAAEKQGSPKANGGKYRLFVQNSSSICPRMFSLSKMRHIEFAASKETKHF